MSGIALGLLLVATLLAGATAVVLLGRARTEPPSRSSRRASAALALLALYVGFCMIGGVVSAISILVSSTVQIDVPVEEFWPTLPSGMEVSGAAAQRVGGGFTVANLTVEGLSPATRGLWAVSQGLDWMMPAAIAGFILVAYRKLRAGQPFAPLLIQLTTVAAAVIGIGGFLSVVLGDFAGSLAADEALRWMSASVDDLPSGNPALTGIVPKSRFGFTVPFWPIGAIVGLGVLSEILRRGQSLEQDTKGLV